MKNIRVAKKCNAEILHKELNDNDFLVIGVSTDGDTTIVHLEDTEIKNIDDLVSKHIFRDAEIKKRNLEKEIDEIKAALKEKNKVGEDKKSIRMI